MKINEIINESALLTELTRPTTIDQAYHILSRAGYDQIGSGYFATVLSKGDGTVLKLFEAEDNAYIRFIAMCQSYPNEHFPKFRGKLIKVNHEYYAIRMENLSMTDHAGNMHNRMSKNEIAHCMSSYIKLMGKRERMSSYDDLFRNQTALEVKKNMLELEKSQPGIRKACAIIAKTIAPFHGVDLHSKNFMYRGSTLVITDPVAF